MAYKYNPLIGIGLDDVGNDADAAAGGSDTQVQFNDGGSLAGITGSSVDATGSITLSLAGDESTPPVSFTGSWFTGGTATTTKPQLLIEPTGTTSTAWSTDGTGLGVNAASGFAGRLLDLQTNGTSQMVVQGDGKVGLGTVTPSGKLDIVTGTTGNVLIDAEAGSNVHAKIVNDSGDIHVGSRSASADTYLVSNRRIYLRTGSSEVNALYVNESGNVGIGSTTPGDKLEIGGAGAGIILASPDGTRYRLTVANGGTLSIAAV